MKAKLLTVAAGLIFSVIATYADDVKVDASGDSLRAANGKIRLELKVNGPAKLADAKNEASLDMSFLDTAGKEKLKTTRWTVEKESPAEAEITVYAGTPEKILVTFAMKKDSEYILVYPGRDTGGTSLEMKSQMSVLPDMLAEDYIYFPEKVKDKCRVPTEAYCLLNLMNDGNSMVACMWTTGDTKVYLGKNSPENKTIDYNIIESGRHKKLYIGIISVPGIWHVVKEKLDTENFRKVDWKAPFNAQWLMTMKLDKGLIPLNDNNFDTWVIPERTPDAKSVPIRMGVNMIKKDIWNTWAGLLGTFVYPFYFEKGNLFARIPKSGRISYNPDYPPVIYAYKYRQTFYFDEKLSQKNQATLPYDKLAEALPYHEILHFMAVSSPESVYPTTCSVTAEMLRYYKDDQAEEKRNVIIRQVDAMNKFVDVKDKRFNEYRSWASQKISELKKISEEKKNLKPLADEMIGDLSLIEKKYIAAKEIVKTPEESARLSARYIELIDDKKLSSEKKEEEVDRLGREIRTMGGARDTLCAQMRLPVKSIRFQLAGKLAGKLTAEEQELAVKLRKDCGDILWLKHGHEGK